MRTPQETTFWFYDYSTAYDTESKKVVSQTDDIIALLQSGFEQRDYGAGQIETLVSTVQRLSEAVATMGAILYEAGLIQNLSEANKIGHYPASSCYASDEDED